MKIQVEELVTIWFKKWTDGDFLELPISKNFKHTSPFGTINGKQKYVQMVENNKDKFLGYKFEILDKIFSKEQACVRYIAI
jgi:hypothetical protein